MSHDRQYIYTKKRSEFGRECTFTDEGPKILQNIAPNRALFNDYMLKNPVNSSVQIGTIMAEHELNTERTIFSDRGMNHVEGGWPRDVIPFDVEQTLRFRKKVEKDEMYIHTVLQLSHSMEPNIHQNNTMNIYETYFADSKDTTMVERSSARTVNVYRDPCNPKRPVTHLSWSPDGGTRIAVSHCNMEFQRAPPDLSNFSYLWEVENPNKPALVLKPSVPIVCLEYNPKDPNSLVSGLHSGQVAVWDVRRGSNPVEISVLEPSHRDPVTHVLWINSKSGTEFFSTSSDGMVKWWDTRKVSEPTETLILDPVKGDEQLLSRAPGGSSLEYEPTIPTRYMVGTENGTVFSCNRKGKTPSEKMTGRFAAHLGPVYAVQRNPGFVKNFLTVGDWAARIWSEDCKESSIIWTSNYRPLLTDGSWSPTRYSVFYTTRMDGALDVWDLLQQQKEAVLSIKVCDYQLRCIRVHEQGQLVAVGNNLGTSYLVEVSEGLTINQRNDKALLTMMLERESRREKILETRMREIRLKLKTKGDKEIGRESRTSHPSLLVQANLVLKAEKEFFSTVAKVTETMLQVEVVMFTMNFLRDLNLTSYRSFRHQLSESCGIEVVCPPDGRGFTATESADLVMKVKQYSRLSSKLKIGCSFFYTSIN
ncbi:dynein intermediate chain 3, ciliary-like [Anabrus simplex]|uniref:dynein intermediate chain 3, ciliary-like n=1 Tax=Anabrus simplex TaxID=316456 RepID=UPI0035A2FA3C